MRKIEIEKTEKHIVYELSEDELEEIKLKARKAGRNDVLKYICFCMINYVYKMNIPGACNFVANLGHFVNKRINTIENTYGYSFSDFLKVLDESEK